MHILTPRKCNVERRGKITGMFLLGIKMKFGFHVMFEFILSLFTFPSRVNYFSHVQ